MIASSITVRPAGPKDYSFIYSLYAETIRPYSIAFFDWIEADQAERFASLYRQAETFVILEHGRDVGWLARRETAQEIILLQFYVAPSHQRRGIGSFLPGRLVEEAERERKSLAVEVLKNNPARRLYERFGLQIAGESEYKFSLMRPAQA